MKALTAISIIILATALPLTPAVAQQADEEDLQPAVDTSVDSFEPAVDTSMTDDDFGPAVDTSAEEFEPAVDTSSVDSPETMAAVQSSGPVMDRLTLGRTEITGNQELPKVMYIVPWQKSDPGDLMGRPVNTLLDEVLAPLDREEFIRQVDYYSDLKGSNED
ncbi:MAG: hypothetical protein QNJ19_01170 [Woeseiaceae bacterium]|nr:hypothetical protein [Woeseiaceae bacterium]